MERNTIFVRNFKTLSLIGIYPKEKKKKQNLKISIKVSLKNIKYEDTIESTVSYEKIISLLKQVTYFPHINLLETLANKILVSLAKEKGIKKIEIEIVKCNILNGNQEVGITLEKNY
tara:strand:+ start:457 stop:807 length:351 start_codon:yes stop_codon:yes gene_type:complete